MSAILQFPAPEYRSASPAPSLRPAPSFEAIDVERSRRLLDLIQEELTKAERLLEFVDTHRAEARKAGIESVAIEVCALVEGGKLDAIADTLVESIEKGIDAQVSAAGMDRVRRVERLLAEADLGVARLELPPGIDQTASLGQYDGNMQDTAKYGWFPIAFIGLAVVGILIVSIASPSKPVPPGDDWPILRRPGSRFRYR
jgi:hypothetical protein